MDTFLNQNVDINKKIETLKVTDTEVDGQFVSEVSQTNGKITVKRKSLPTEEWTFKMEDGSVITKTVVVK